MTRQTPPPVRAVHEQPIRIVIADDHAIVREGLRALVELQPGMTVIGEAADGQEAWQHACNLSPDVLVLDLSMPIMGGAETAERIARECPGVRILALTMHEERGYVTRLIRAGASGYLLKRSASTELIRALRVISAGGSYVDPSLAGSLLLNPNSTSAVSETRTALPKLSAREKETLQLIARGHTNKEIAASLEISVKTVETHRANAMTKLGLANRAALVRFAMDEGWLA